MLRGELQAAERSRDTVPGCVMLQAASGKGQASKQALKSKHGPSQKMTGFARTMDYLYGRFCADRAVPKGRQVTCHLRRRSSHNSIWLWRCAWRVCSDVERKSEARAWEGIGGYGGAVGTLGLVCGLIRGRRLTE